MTIISGEDNPPSGKKCALLQAELALPLATAQTALERLRANQLEPQQHTDGALESLAEFESMLDGVIALSFGLSPTFPRRRTALAPLIEQAVAGAGEAGGESRVRTQLDSALHGHWNAWVCRRTVHELVTFALALTDADIDVTARPSGESVRLTVHVTGVRPTSEEGQTLARELGSSPSQYHLWLACRLVESSGGQLESAADSNGWVGLTATLPGLLDGND